MTCAGCHVRNWARHGPPRIAPSLLPVPGYPLVDASRSTSAPTSACRVTSCRRAPRSPASRCSTPTRSGSRVRTCGAASQCQHCHMPNREHTFLGIHDRDTFRQGIQLDRERAPRAPARSRSSPSSRNIGAGHYLPTTPTPAAWLTIELRRRARPRDRRRDATSCGSAATSSSTARWHERADTRIPPGETRDVRARMVRRPHRRGHGRARHRRGPPRRLLRALLRATRSPASSRPTQRALYEQALARAHAARTTSPSSATCRSRRDPKRATEDVADCTPPAVRCKSEPLAAGFESSPPPGVTPASDTSTRSSRRWVASVARNRRDWPCGNSV